MRNATGPDRKMRNNKDNCERSVIKLQQNKSTLSQTTKTKEDIDEAEVINSCDKRER